MTAHGVVFWTSLVVMAAGQGPIEPGIGRLRLKVVDAVSLATVESAEVRAHSLGQERGSMEESARSLIDRRRAGEVLLPLGEGGPKGLTNDQGMAELPLQSVPSFLVVSKGAMTRTLFLISAPSEILEVALWPFRKIRVLVRDGEGRPVEDIAVVLREESPVLGESRRWANTGADGLAVFEGCFDASTRWSTSLVSSGSSVPLNLDARVDTGPNAIFGLPPTGSIRLSLETAAGLSFSGEVAAVLLESDEDQRRVNDGKDMEELLATWPGEVSWMEQGVIRFRHIRPSPKLRFAVVDLLSGFVEVRTIDGPSAPGAEVATTISLPAPATLTGRVIDDGGAPIRGIYVGVSWNSGNSKIAGLRKSTDADGRFRLQVLDKSLHEGSEVVLIFEQTRSAGQIHTAGPHRIKLPPMREQQHDLGSFTLAPPDLIARGRIVDLAGTPMPGIYISVERRKGERWVQEMDIETLSGADGTFRLEGQVDSGELRLVAIRSGKPVCAPCPIERGIRGVELRATPPNGR